MTTDTTFPRAGTSFATPERATGAALRAQIAQLTQHPVVDAVLRSVGGAAVLLNAHRQIVSANARYLETLGVQQAEEILGMRPGESIDCVHAWENPAGCGTGPSCAGCGAAIAMVAALQASTAEERDCVVTCGGDGGPRELDLRVRASPLELAGETYLLFLLQDVSVEKRREALERAFFHEVADLAAALSAATVQLQPADPAEVRAVAGDIRLLSSRLARELLIQRSLATHRPDVGDPLLEPIDVAGLVEALRTLGASHAAAAGKGLVVTSTLRALTSDRMLLERILGCMVVNALEASPRGARVRLEAFHRDGDACFEVWNPGAIPESARGRVFQRFFTTKPGPGRGQGTFLMRLFGEKWLGGKVGFRTGDEGTTFFFRVPARVRTEPEPTLPPAC